jgi:hypothetical protein
MAQLLQYYMRIIVEIVRQNGTTLVLVQAIQCIFKGCFYIILQGNSCRTKRAKCLDFCNHTSDSL